MAIHLFGKLPFSALVLFAVALYTQQAVAKECQMMVRGAWKHNGGSFVRRGESQTWYELNAEGEGVAVYKEYTRKDDMIVIHDEEREMFVLLRPDLAAVMSKGMENFSPLFQGAFVKAVSCV